ncbi:hypothetical protein M9458_037536, partial [Cirrhinus mrigala]
VYLRAVSSLDAGDVSWGDASSPHDNRRRHRVLLSLSQYQLPQRIPLLQQT